MGEKMNRFHACLLLVLIVAGCSHQKLTHVNVYAENRSTQEVGKGFVILESKSVQEQTADALRGRFQGYVEKALVLSGFRKVDDLEAADVVIILSYGSGPPSEHALLTTDNIIYSENPKNYLSSMRLSERTYIRKEKATTYMRYLIIGAVDFKEYTKTGKIKPLWRTTATHLGKNDKLEKIFAYLVAASQPYLGKHVPEKVDIALTRKDEMLMKIKAPGAGDTQENESLGK